MMSGPRVYEGTMPEIVEQLRNSSLTGRYRVIVVSGDEGEFDGSRAGETLLERLQGRVGRFDFGDANLSEDTGRKFADLLAERHRAGRE